jgi:hypothetical protein
MEIGDEHIARHFTVTQAIEVVRRPSIRGVQILSRALLLCEQCIRPEHVDASFAVLATGKVSLTLSTTATQSADSNNRAMQITGSAIDLRVSAASPRQFKDVCRHAIVFIVLPVFTSSVVYY